MMMEKTVLRAKGSIMTDEQSTWARRIANLIAKAESTNNQHESEAFMAKAQELMVQHSIDEMMLDRSGTARQEIITSHVKIEAPYTVAKGQLLHGIAKANGVQCFYVGKATAGAYTLVGFSTDVENTRTLFATLQVHATREMLRAQQPGEENTKSFRNSFMQAYAQHIRVTLNIARREAEAEAKRDRREGGQIAVMLRDKVKQVEDFVMDQFGPLRSSSSTYSNSSSGREAGRSAASKADIGKSKVGQGGTFALGSGKEN